VVPVVHTPFGRRLLVETNERLNELKRALSEVGVDMSTPGQQYMLGLTHEELVLIQCTMAIGICTSNGSLTSAVVAMELMDTLLQRNGPGLYLNLAQKIVQLHDAMHKEGECPDGERHN